MGGLSKEGQNPSTDPPTYQIIEVTNANHMRVMKTSLTIIPLCPRERFSHYKNVYMLDLCYKKDWDTLLQKVNKVNKVQQGGPIRFLAKDKPGHTLI